MGKFTPEKVAIAYSLVSWDGKTGSQAKSTVMSMSEDEVSKRASENASIVIARREVASHIEELKGKNKYACILQILEKIHDTWVEQNVKKYDRGTPDKSQKKIFQHLPLAMIGEAEMALDLMFLAPFLKEAGIRVGKMSEEPYGSFATTKAMSEAYTKYVKQFLRANNIKNTKDMRKNIEAIIDSYPSLHTGAELDAKRLAYMKDKLPLLCQEVTSKLPKSISTKHSERV